MNSSGGSEVTTSDSLKDTWLEVAVGIDGHLSRNNTYYLEYLQTTGSKEKTNYQFNAGVRWNW